MPIPGPGPSREPGVRLCVGLAVLLAACSGGSDPGDRGDTPSNVIVSTPFRLASGGQGAPEAVVYVSAPPQSAAGSLVTIMNQGTSAAMSLRLTNGGFDPVRLVASEGDRIRVTYDEADPSIVTVRRRPPRVVRSSPGPNMTDVPLNLLIEVVFSAPVTQESVDDGVRLRRLSGEPVPGEFTLSGDGLVLEIQPTFQLDPRADYVLEVTTDVRDELGSPLEERVSVPFTTGTTLGPVPSPPTTVPDLDMTPAMCCPTGRYRAEGHLFGIEPGTTMVFQVLALGSALTAVAAGTSDVRVAGAVPADRYLTVIGRAPGRVHVSAVTSRFRAGADVLVYGPLEVPVEAQYQVVGVDDHGRLASALLNGSRVRLLNDTITDVASWAPMTAGRLAFARESGGIFIRERNGVLSPVAHSPSIVRCVGASRDGRWISWVAAAGPSVAGSAPSMWNIMAARVGDRGQVRVLVANRSAHNCPAWSPSGELVYQGQLLELRIIHPDGLNDRPYATSNEGLILPSEWSWDQGRRLVVENYSIRVGNANGANSINLFAYGLGSRVSWSGDGRYLMVPQPFGITSGARSFPMRSIITTDGLHRADLPTLSLMLQDIAFVPW